MTIVFLRTIFMFAFIIFSLRLMGKKQLGELQPSELVSTIIISSLATVTIESPELPIWVSVVPVLVIVAFEILLSIVSMKSVKASRLISGNPRILIKSGVLDQKVMAELRYTVEDLLESLRAKDIFELDEVDFAMVETSGKISVRKKADCKAKDNVSEKPATIPPLPIVIDGCICYKNMHHCNVNEAFISDICNKNNLNIRDILVLLCDDAHMTTLIKKQRKCD